MGKAKEHPKCWVLSFRVTDADMALILELRQQKQLMGDLLHGLVLDGVRFRAGEADEKPR